MSTPKLNLFPARVPIGSVEMLGDDGKPISYPVMASAELTRAFSGLFDRIGGANGLGSEDLSLLSSFSYTPDPTDARAIADLETDFDVVTVARVAVLERRIEDVQLDRDPGQVAEIAALKRQVEDLRIQVEGFASMEAFIAALRQRLDDLDVRADYRPDYRVNWERPGQLGSLTANSAAVTTLTASGAVTLSPASANVVLSPTGTGVVTINPATAGTLNNIAIGGSTPLAGAFTTISATGVMTSTVATGTAPFSVVSTTNVANLNASSLGGATFAAPGAIGGGTAAAGTFTSLTATATTTLSTTNMSNLLSITKNGNSTQIVAAFRNTDGTAAGAGQTRVDWGNDAGTNKFTIGLNASTHATKPGWAEIIQQTNQPLILAQNGNTSITINSTGTGFFGVAAVARQVSGGLLAGVITGLINLGLFSS